jgi:hypothetical protein
MEIKVFRVIWTGIIGMLIMIPAAYICFLAFDLISLLTGGLIQNFGSIAGGFVMFIIGALLGIFIICLFPVHWVLINQPDNVLFMLALVVPWIGSCTVMALLTSKSPEEGFFTSLMIGIGFFILMAILYGVVAVFLAAVGGAALLDSASIGLTDLPFLLAALTATMEGAAIGGVFAALIGSLKYEK